jgi:hypothetical protein
VTSRTQNYINHIVIALDASASMEHLADALVKVIDNLVADLAVQSKQMDQETRLTIYSFDTETKCLIWDMDVLRVPSIAKLYKVNPLGWTALIDATLTAIKELGEVTQIHGDHSFLLYVATDGVENRSRNSPSALSGAIGRLPENWTMGALVPNFQGVASAKAFGFPPGNVMTWDATSVRGVKEVGEAVTAATQSFMVTRATGARSTKNLFGGAATVNAATVAAAKLKPVDPKTYKLVPVIPTDAVKNDKGHIEIAPYVRSVNNGLFRTGTVYYPVVPGIHRNPRIDPQKDIAILNKKTRMLYTGPGIRTMLGIPENAPKTVKPDTNPDYIVYVRSDSPNRYLTPHSEILMFQ